MSKKVDLKEMIGGCCVCSDERGWSENPLVYCDGTGCSVAVHQACYGIVQVPTGPWFCKKCESQERVARVKCELCPQRAGALKRTDAGGWCHVVCALYIPEAGFANVQTMEPIVLSGVPHERFNKTCYICEEAKRDTKATAGACMQCDRNGCKQYFHVTCAQAQGLLCEVTGSYENVKYCGYCSHHYKKLKNHSNVKTIPAFKPIQNDSGTPDSSPEKNTSVITEEDTKLPIQPAVKEVKSPQVDQSVSSTSDSLPPTLIPNNKPVLSSVSRSYSEISDISSALSPADIEETKSCGSDQNQEPSSSMPILDAPSLPRNPFDKGSGSDNVLEIDVEDAGKVPTEMLVNSPPIPLTLENKASVVPKRQRSIHVHKGPTTSKKNKTGLISSTVTNNSSASGKEGKKTAGKKRREGSTNSKPVDMPVSTSASLPGHHDYCGSIFGGSPYFQSLSAPGHVTIPKYSSQDNCTATTGTNPLLQPPKHFPSLLTGLPGQNQDRSQDFPLTMEQLLEQQWEQGAQFLMEQGHHFDISSLLNCLHRLKGENQGLEDHVRGLASRRDHLMAVNARLTLPMSLYEGISSSSKSSSLGSLEDISSPDDVQTPKLGPTSLASVQIPSNSDLIAEDILSPADAEQSSLSSDCLKFRPEGTSASSNYIFSDQACPAQPLMYSVVNPPPPTLSAVSSSIKPSISSSSLSSSSSSSSSPPLTLPKLSMPPILEAPQISNLGNLLLTNPPSTVEAMHEYTL